MDLQLLSTCKCGSCYVDVNKYKQTQVIRSNTTGKAQGVFYRHYLTDVNGCVRTSWGVSVIF